MPPSRLLPAGPLLALVLLAALACRSNGTREETARAGKPEPFVPLPDEERHTIGYFLTLFDRSLEQWSQYQLSAYSPREKNSLLALERDMEKRARERRDELVAVFESGAPVNRRIAAAALGFTHDPTVLGALLGGLSDRDPELVQKLLLAIGVLALPETPLAEIRFLLERDADAWTRNNAAFALLAVARAGNTSSELVDGCRTALADPEPGVRAQCASALGVLADEAAVPALRALLQDEANLAAMAAAFSLASIGRAHPQQKGAVARALADAFDQASSGRRAHLHGALRWLSDQELGDDARPWREWAYKLP
jgi:HEAT repeat protein